MKVKELIKLLKNENENLEVLLPVYDGYDSINSVEKINVTTIADEDSKLYEYIDSKNNKTEALLLNGPKKTMKVVVQ